MSTDKPASPQNDETIAFLEEALAAAKAGRLLFLVASVGAVSERTAPASPDTSLPSFAAAATPSDQIAPLAFQVQAGVFSTEATAHLHPASRSGALSDTLRGAVGAIQSVTGGSPVAATPPAKKLVSLE